MKKLDKDTLKLAILLLVVIFTMWYVYLIVKHKTKDYVRQDIKIDSIQSEIDDIDTVINSIPFTYPSDVRSDYFKNYSNTR